MRDPGSDRPRTRAHKKLEALFTPPTWTKAKLARKLRKTPQAVGNWLAMGYRPDDKTIAKIAKLIPEVTPEDWQTPADGDGDEESDPSKAA